ncbi:MAG: thioredoxin [Candidatus Odinarchaeota archaeon]
MTAADNELESLKKKRIEQFTSGNVESNVIKIPKGVVHLTDANFAEFLKKYSDVPVFIDYWAVWCRPCQMVAPTIEKLEEKYRGKMIFAKLNTDENPRTAQSLGIYSIPTFHVFYKGKIADTFVGAMPYGAFEKRIQQSLNKVKQARNPNPLYI